LFFGKDSSGSDCLGQWVQFVHEFGILEGVLLSVVDLLLRNLVSEDGLNFIRVDDSGNIGIGQDGSGQSEVDLLGRFLLVGSVDGIELLEGSLGPDDESSQMTSGGQLEEIESADGS
jgi:hypothetical protein